MRIAVWILLLALPACASSQAFTKEEQRRILAHGPWPPPARKDPDNRVSAKPEAIAFGERLFFEPRLSGTGSVLCASCHEPYRDFQDARPRGFGLGEVERNTPGLRNVALYRSYGWDGANDELWAQSIRPLLAPREMRASAAHVAATVRKLFANEYRAAFGRATPADDQALLVDVGKALAAYQETLVTRRTPFDEFRDSLQHHASSSYPLAARRGLKIFVGKGGCGACHSGPQFTNASRVGIAKPAHSGPFRVPGLRNVARTAPYLHDGSVATLREAVRHSSALTPGEIDDLVAFLESLSDE